MGTTDMHLVAIMPVRNEAWVISASLRIALKWCDEVVVLAHCCTDDTVGIVIDVAEENVGRVTLIVEDSPNWAEMDHRQRLLEEARKRKATHIAIVDADEVLTGNLLPVIREKIQLLSPGTCAYVGMPCLWRALDQYRVDPSIWSNRMDLCLAFADHPNLCWRTENGYDHHHREPFNSTPLFIGNTLDGGVMHLQWANWRRLVAKQTWYQMMEVLKYPNRPTHSIVYDYSRSMNEVGLRVAATPSYWWGAYGGLEKGIDLVSPSWHEKEIERLVREYGVERFNGLAIGEPVCR